MNTLLNGSFHGEEAASPYVGVTPDMIPKARNAETGVSVKYVESASMTWYVFRATYGREVQVSNKLIDAGIYTYVPRRYEMVEVNGRRKKVLKSLIPNIVFAYTSRELADFYTKGPSKRDIVIAQKGQHNQDSLFSQEDLTRAFSTSTMMSYYYNHFERVNDSSEKNPPLVITSKDMMNFIRATYTQSPHLKQVDMERCRFLNDKFVEVIQGDYKGIKGRVARIGGQQVIVVSVANGKWNISTDYIPKPFIRVIN